jgi:predicted nucleic acid-binding protein
VIYLDTNVIVSYMDELDANHERAVRLLDGLKGERVVSRLTLVELASVYSRAGLEAPLSLALYSIDSAGARIGELDFNEAIMLAFRFSESLRLRTLDLLHLVSCKLLGADQFATFDRDIIAKSDSILRTLGVRVITIE